MKKTKCCKESNELLARPVKAHECTQMTCHHLEACVQVCIGANGSNFFEVGIVNVCVQAEQALVDVLHLVVEAGREFGI